MLNVNHGKSIFCHFEVQIALLLFLYCFISVYYFFTIWIFMGYGICMGRKNSKEKSTKINLNLIWICLQRRWLDCEKSLNSIEYITIFLVGSRLFSLNTDPDPVNFNPDPQPWKSLRLMGKHWKECQTTDWREVK